LSLRYPSRMTDGLFDWLSTGEAARYLGLSRQRIDQLAREGRLPSEVVGGRRLIHRRHLDALAAASPVRRRGRPRTLRELRWRRAQILELAKRHHLSNVRVFGSVARGDAGPSSDVDLLVRRDKGASALEVAEFAVDLEELLGCTVDIAVDEGTSPALEAVRASAVPV
jgi:uncharacterized protein